MTHDPRPQPPRHCFREADHCCVSGDRRNSDGYLSMSISKPGVIAGFITGLVLSWLIQQWGCTAINVHQDPPQDWPQLTMSVHQTGFWEVQKQCDRNIAAVVLVGPAFGCARVNFDDMTCRIYLASDDELLREHEESHCKGYDHFGSSVLRDYWESWKRERK